jgi:hypothetical protein
MYLMGWAFFSAQLMRALEPCSVESVALVLRDDEVLRPLFEQYTGLRVVVCPITVQTDSRSFSTECHMGLRPTEGNEDASRAGFYPAVPISAVPPGGRPAHARKSVFKGALAPGIEDPALGSGTLAVITYLS